MNFHKKIDLFYKLAQNRKEVAPQTKEVIKGWVINYVNNLDNIKVNNAFISLEPTTDRNFLFVKFGQKPNQITRINSEVVKDMEDKLNRVIENDERLKYLFSKEYSPFEIEIKATEFNPKNPAAVRKVRTELSTS